MLKSAATTGATPDGFAPETNQIQAASREPQLQAVTVPRADHQPLVEASFVKMPSLYPRNTDSPLCHMDLVISCNKGAHSMGQTRWTLTREVLRMCDTVSIEHLISTSTEWAEKEEQAAVEKAVTKEGFQGEWTNAISCVHCCSVRGGRLV